MSTSTQEMTMSTGYPEPTVGHGADGGLFRVLLVCTANQCRSPLAERLLHRAQLRRSLGWRVTSAGTRADDGLDAHPFTKQILSEEGLALTPHWATRRLTPAIVQDSDLILTATVDHRREVVRLVPAAVNRTYPLLQMARFAAAVDPIRTGPKALVGQELISRVRTARAGLQPVAAGADDIDDPIGRPIRVHRAAADRMHAAIETILAPVAL